MNDDDRKPKQPRTSFASRRNKEPPTLGFSTALKDDTYSALSVLLHNHFLNWRDAMALGNTCRDLRKTWIEAQETYMSPLLNVLENIVGPEDESDELSIREWLLDEQYDSFTNTKKCQAMVSMIHYDLAKAVRELYPSASELELLGPVLTKKVVLI